MSNPKRKYLQWEEADMERAITAYHNGDMGLNAVCRNYGVPKKTLKRRIAGSNIYATDAKKVFGRPADLPVELENQLVGHILDLQRMFFGLTREDLKKLAYEVAEKNNIPHRFNQELKMAGNKWYYSFISRHPELSLRKPEATSMARAAGFSKERTDEFFDVLTKLIDRNKLQAANIYNVDETALSTVQKPRKILAKKGSHQVGSITSAERGTLTTGIFCMSAIGVFVPPMLVFKGKRFKPEWKIGAPPGTAFDLSESGWSNSEVFLNWLKHFVAFVKPTIENKVLLILDGHTSHTKDLSIIDYAKQNGIIMLSLPSHTSHRLQPLDVSFFGPLKTNFNTACEKYIRTHLTKITVSHISTLLNESYPKTAVVATAMNGFRSTGIWPLDRDVFQESDFAIPTNVTNLPDSASTEPSHIIMPSTSKLSDTESQEIFTEANSSSDDLFASRPFLSVKDVSPLPDASKIMKKKKTLSAPTPAVEILTSTPYKEKLIKKEEEKSDKIQKKKLRQQKKSMNEEAKKKSCSEKKNQFCK